MLPQAKVESLRRIVRGKLKVAAGLVEPRVPEGETQQRAYELSWSGRPDPGMQVTFENVGNWTVDALAEGEVRLAASVGQRLWRPRVGKLLIAKSEQPVSVALRPKAPLSIHERFDGVNFWVYGHKHFIEPGAVPIQCPHC